MDASTRKVFEKHSSELQTVRELLRSHAELLSDVKSGLAILNSTATRIERMVKALPCSTEPPCDERTPARTPNALRNRRLKVASG